MAKHKKPTKKPARATKSALKAHAADRRLARTDLRHVASKAGKAKVRAARKRVAACVRSNPVVTGEGRVLKVESCSPPVAERLLADRGHKSTPSRKGTGARGRRGRLPRVHVNADGSRCTYQSAQMLLHMKTRAGREGATAVSSKSGKTTIQIPIGMATTAMVVD
jgi:hypothetical protein